MSPDPPETCGCRDPGGDDRPGTAGRDHPPDPSHRGQAGSCCLPLGLQHHMRSSWAGRQSEMGRSGSPQTQGLLKTHKQVKHVQPWPLTFNRLTEACRLCSLTFRVKNDMFTKNLSLPCCGVRPRSRSRSRSPGSSWTIWWKPAASAILDDLWPPSMRSWAPNSWRGCFVWRCLVYLFTKQHLCLFNTNNIKNIKFKALLKLLINS